MRKWEAQISNRNASHFLLYGNVRCENAKDGKKFTKYSDETIVFMVKYKHYGDKELTFGHFWTRGCFLF